MKKSLAVRGRTLSAFGFQPFDFLICGQEEVKVTNETLLYVYNQNTGSDYTQIVNFRSWMESSFKTICPIVSWDLHEYFNYVYTPYQRSIVKVNQPSYEIKISTSQPFHFYIYLKATTVGSRFNYKRIEIEVCGGEVVQFRKDSRTSLSYELLQFSGGYDETHEVHPRNFLQTVKSTSVNCLIEVPLTRLYIKDPSSGSLRDFNGDDRVWIK